MKNTGIVRNIDNLGRIVIPKELRDSMDIHKQDEVEIFVNNNEIIIKKYELTCIFCGSTENIIDFKNYKICEDCLTNIIQDEDVDKGMERDKEDEVPNDSQSQQSSNFIEKIINFFKK